MDGEEQQPEEPSDIDKLVGVLFWAAERVGEMTAVLVAEAQARDRYVDVLAAQNETMRSFNETLRSTAEKMAEHTAAMRELLAALDRLKPDDFMGSVGGGPLH